MFALCSARLHGIITASNFLCYFIIYISVSYPKVQTVSTGHDWNTDISGVGANTYPLHNIALVRKGTFGPKDPKAKPFFLEDGQ